MSRENVEAVRIGVAAFNRRDFAALADVTTDDFEFLPYFASMIESRVYRGLDGLRRYFADADGVWQSIDVRVDDIRDCGDRVVLLGEIHGRGRTSRLEAQLPLAWVAEFRDEKVRRLQSYVDVAEALDAVGLRE